MVRVRKIVAEVSGLRRSKVPPTEHAEFTEPSAGGCSPTDFTDLHRWLGFGRFSHRLHRIHRTFCWGMFSHRFHRSAQIVWVRRFSHRFHRFHRNSCGGIHSASSSVGSVDSVGEYTKQAVLCKSVKSVGEYTQQAVLWVLWIPWENTLSKQFCGFCGFRGGIH